MAATYLKGSFLRAVCSHLRANIPPLPLSHFYVLMNNPLEEKNERKDARGRRSKKSLKLMSICLPRIYFLFRDNLGLILI
jgi:hypothetical protein